jgi:sulfate adenylyltransferase subunit 1
MSHQSTLIEADIDKYLEQHESKEMLRFLTCGSVDDGKSTLIGRLLHDSKMIFEDQLAAIEKDSTKHGTTGEKIDLALLVDGLQAEREQGITIDVAYRYFSTDKRKFIIADTPGHEQYTRNMVTGASTCDLAIILIDARYGVQTQTRRHSYIASLLGIKHIVVAINKMDLLDFDQGIFEAIKADYGLLADKLGMTDVHFVPMSALDGDNVVSRSERCAWYQGQTLMEILETVKIAEDRNLSDFRFPVQYVNRPNLNFRGFCGTVASGVVAPGDEIKVLPSGKTSRVKAIVTADGEQQEAFCDQSVTLTLTDEIDVSRGDVLVKAADAIGPFSALTAHLVWMSETALDNTKEYLFKFSTKLVSGHVNRVQHRIDVNTQQEERDSALGLNDIGLVAIELSQHVLMEAYGANRATGSFIVIDRLTNITVGAGMVVSGNEGQLKGVHKHQFSEFEVELNQLIRKHFPHWNAKTITN